MKNEWKPFSSSMLNVVSSVASFFLKLRDAKVMINYLYSQCEYSRQEIESLSFSKLEATLMFVSTET